MRLFAVGALVVCVLAACGEPGPPRAGTQASFSGPVRLFEPLSEGQVFLLAGPPTEDRDHFPPTDVFTVRSGETRSRQLTDTGQSDWVSAHGRRAVVNQGGFIFRLDPRRMNRFKGRPLAVGVAGSVGPGGCLGFSVTISGKRRWRHAAFRSTIKGGPEIELLERHADGGALCLSKGRTVVSWRKRKQAKLLVYKGRRLLRTVIPTRPVIRLFPRPGGGFASSFGGEQVEIFTHGGRRSQVIALDGWIAKAFDARGESLLVLHPGKRRLGLMNLDNRAVREIGEIAPGYEVTTVDWAHWPTR